MGLERMNTLHIFTHQDSRFIGGVGQEFRNTLEEIAVEGVGQNTLRLIGGSWSRVYQKIHRAIAIMGFCILDQLPP